MKREGKKEKEEEEDVWIDGGREGGGAKDGERKDMKHERLKEREAREENKGNKMNMDEERRKSMQKCSHRKNE